MRKKEVFSRVVKHAGVTGNRTADGIIGKIFAGIAHCIAFAFVGLLYALKFISGSRAGKVVYAIVWVILLVVAVVIIRF